MKRIKPLACPSSIVSSQEACSLKCFPSVEVFFDKIFHDRHKGKVEVINLTRAIWKGELLRKTVHKVISTSKNLQKRMSYMTRLQNECPLCKKNNKS